MESEGSVPDAHEVAAAITRNTSDLYRYLAEHVGPLPGVQYVETAPALRQVKRLG